MNEYQKKHQQVSGPDNIMSEWRARDVLVRDYAWAIPNHEAIEACAALSPIVEVGAGSGYWAHIGQRMAASQNHQIATVVWNPRQDGDLASAR